MPRCCAKRAAFFAADNAPPLTDPLSMSHFAGYLTAGSQPAPAIEQALQGQLARDAERPLQTLREGPLWLATQSVAVWRSTVAEQQAGRVSALVGDPIWLVHEDEAAHPATSAQRLAEALTSNHPEALSACRGSFAALGWDGAQLLLSTDAIGSRPLYWKRERERLLFATSLRLLRALQAEPEQVDEAGLAESLFFGQALGKRTVLAGVQVLMPGQALRARPGQSPELLTWFDLAAVPAQTLDAEATVARLHQVFARAVQRRLLPGPQQAFLSGGLDSRAVVAALVDAGQSVQSFCAAYPGSLDDLVGEQIAQVLGTQHRTWHRSPADRVRVALDPFALYAREHFPAPSGVAGAPRAIWSGDGGSVTLGHVYLSPESVARTAQPGLNADRVRQLFPALAGRPTRQLSRQRLQAWADMATEGALQALQRTADAAPDRRLFLFYMQNDQARHLYHHFERIASSGVELLTPFFDSDFVRLVQSLPIAGFLRHGVYNDWIQRFGCAAGSVYWQPYRNHLPGPHAKPSTIADQWDGSWYGGAEVRRSYRAIAGEVLARRDPLSAPFLSRPLLHLARLRHGLGLAGQEYEVAYARNLVHTLARD
jgi:asparagine synthase (glutamine-hydrolysing)